MVINFIDGITSCVLISVGILFMAHRTKLLLIEYSYNDNIIIMIFKVDVNTSTDLSRILTIPNNKTPFMS